jgi:hypothetical protein
MVVYTIVEKAPHSDCVHAILAQLEKARDVFAAAKELGGGRATSALVIFSRHVCRRSHSSITADAPGPLRIVPTHHR